MGPVQLSLIQPTFSYSALDRETEVSARSDVALIKGLMRRTAEDVIEIGNALIRQKQRLPHGLFLPWIEAEFGMSQSAADRFVQVARTYAGKLPTVGNLSQTALYELAAPSTAPEVREEIERRITAGELINVEDVRRLRAEYAEVAAKARELGMETEAVREQNRDLIANAHRVASEEADKRYSALVDDLKKRVALAEETAAKSIESANADAAAHPGEAVVVPFTPRDDGEEVTEPDPFGGDGVDDVDLNDMRVGAHVIYGSLSSIDIAKTTPEIFWSLFGTPNGKAGTKKWLLSTLKKLNAIKKGMPK